MTRDNKRRGRRRGLPIPQLGQEARSDGSFTLRGQTIDLLAQVGRIDARSLSCRDGVSRHCFVKNLYRSDGSEEPTFWFAR